MFVACSSSIRMSTHQGTRASITAEREHALFVPARHLKSWNAVKSSGLWKVIALKSILSVPTSTFFTIAFHRDRHTNRSVKIMYFCLLSLFSAKWINYCHSPQERVTSRSLVDRYYSFGGIYYPCL